ncbi:hypothetical protein L345_04964, partial [Ophiophagus hannah]
MRLVEAFNGDKTRSAGGKCIPASLKQFPARPLVELLYVSQMGHYPNYKSQEIVQSKFTRVVSFFKDRPSVMDNDLLEDIFFKMTKSADGTEPRGVLLEHRIVSENYQAYSNQCDLGRKGEEKEKLKPAKKTIGHLDNRSTEGKENFRHYHLLSFCNQKKLDSVLCFMLISANREVCYGLNGQILTITSQCLRPMPRKSHLELICTCGTTVNPLKTERLKENKKLDMILEDYTICKVVFQDVDVDAYPANLVLICRHLKSFKILVVSPALEVKSGGSGSSSSGRWWQHLEHLEVFGGVWRRRQEMAAGVSDGSSTWKCSAVVDDNIAAGDSPSEGLCEPCENLMERLGVAAEGRGDRCRQGVQTQQMAAIIVCFGSRAEQRLLAC